MPEAHRPAPDDDVCSLCGSPVATGRDRCGMCGMVVGIGPGHRNPFSQAALWATIGGLVAIYVVVLVLVLVLN